MFLYDLTWLFTDIGDDTDNSDQEQGQESSDEYTPEEDVEETDDEVVDEIDSSDYEDLLRAKEELEYLLSIPKIADIIARGDFGEGADTQHQESMKQSDIDPIKDPAGYLKQLVADAVRNEVSNVVRGELGNLQSTLQPLLEENYEKQAIQEFNIVKSKYPTVKGIGLNTVLNTLARHPTLTMEEAFLLNANKQRSMSKPPILEQSSKRSPMTGSEESKLLVERAKNLRERAEEINKQGMGLRAIAMKFLKGAK